MAYSKFINNALSFPTSQLMFIVKLVVSGLCLRELLWSTENIPTYTSVSKVGPCWLTGGLKLLKDSGGKPQEHPDRSLQVARAMWWGYTDYLSTMRQYRGVSYLSLEGPHWLPLLHGLSLCQQSWVSSRHSTFNYLFFRFRKFFFTQICHRSLVPDCLFPWLGLSTEEWPTPPD